MPASSRTARIGPPAMTPVPGAAGFMNTLTGADLQRHLVRNRPLDHRNGDQSLTRLLDALADRFGNFACLADRKAHAALAVADDDERAETETLAAFDDLRHAVDAHDGLLEARVVAIAPPLYIIGAPRCDSSAF